MEYIFSLETSRTFAERVTELRHDRRADRKLKNPNNSCIESSCRRSRQCWDDDTLFNITSFSRAFIDRRWFFSWPRGGAAADLWTRDEPSSKIRLCVLLMTMYVHVSLLFTVSFLFFIHTCLWGALRLRESCGSVEVVRCCNTSCTIYIINK